MSSTRRPLKLTRGAGSRAPRPTAWTLPSSRASAPSGGRRPGTRPRRNCADTTPGIGEATAAALLAEVPDIKQYKSAREAAAFAGLVPRERQSGSSVRGRVRLSKIGNSRLRKALYFPAVTALRCSPFFQAWAEGLRQRGKSKMAVIGAVMRKLIHLAYGVLKTGKPFDPEWAQRA